MNLNFFQIKRFALISFLGLASFSQAQLSKQINQYMVYQPVINFAASSSYNSITSAIYYRSQWSGFNGAPESYGLNIAMPIKKKKSVFSSNSTIGIGAYRDKIGVHKNEAIELNYAYQMKLNRKTFLSFSLSPQIRFITANLNLTNFNNKLDPTLNQAAVNKIAPNFKFGSYLFKKNFYFGIATSNLLYNNIDFGSLSSKIETGFDFNRINYFVHSGYQFLIDKKNDIIVSTLIKEGQGAAVHYNINAMWQYMKGNIGLGVSYRSSNDLVFITNFKIIQRFTFSYAYQHALSSISSYENGSHEIMLLYKVKPTKQLIRISTPRF